jgi:peptide/nickel transport system ATP-binding protein
MAAASSDARAVDIRDLDVTFATDGGDARRARCEPGRAPGEVLAIVGESGSGKTVTARSILGLLPETALTQGAVVLDGTDVIGLDREAMRRVRGTKAAMIFQEPSTALNPVFTVGWQLAEGLRAHGKYSKKQARARSRCSAASASPIPSGASTTTRTSSPAGRSSASSSRWRWRSIRP